MAALPIVKPSGGTPTAEDFVRLQTLWALALNPIIRKASQLEGVQVGMMLLWPLPEAPEKYLACSGQVLLQKQYPQLFQVIGTSQNTGGEPAGSFRLPAPSGPYTLIIRYTA